MTPMPSVRALLLWLVLSGLLPATIGAAVLFVHMYQDGRTQLQKNMMQTARAMMQTVDTQLLEVQSAAQVLSTFRYLAKQDFASFHRQAQEVLTRSGIGAAIVLSDERGNTFLDTRREVGEPLPHLDIPAQSRSVFTTGLPVISDIYIDRTKGLPLVRIDVPVLSDGKIVYRLGIVILAENFTHILRKQRLPTDWIASIFDRTGTTAGRHYAPEQFVGKKGVTEFIQRMLEVPEGVLEATSAEGIPVLVIYSRSPVSNWSVALSIPREGLEAELRHTIFLFGLGIALLFGVGVASALFLSGMIARSVRALMVPAIALEAGEALAFSKVYFREADEVAKAMRRMAQSLAQRTLALQASRQTLEKSEGRYRTLVEWSPETILIYRDGIVLYVNPAAIMLFGAVSAQDMIGKPVIDLIHPDFQDRLLKRLQEHFMHGAAMPRIEVKSVRLDTTVIDVEIQSTSIVYDGQMAILTAMRDVTERKQAELDMQQKQKEIMHLSRVTMLGELSGALAHELNQPLTAILSNAQAAQRFLARDPVDLNEVRDILQDIVEEDKRAGEVIHRLRVLLRSGKVQRQAVDVNIVVAEVGKLLRSDLINQGVTLRTECATDVGPGYADPVQLQQVLINLVMNACDAMSTVAPLTRCVRVRTSLFEGSSVRVSVVDHGVGIAPDSFLKIFDAFYSTKPDGMGLGLSICRNIVEANGGLLWGENNTDGGAVFHFTVPLYTGETP